MFLVTLMCLKNSILMGIYFRDIFPIKNSRGANNYGQSVLEKNIYFIA